MAFGKGFCVESLGLRVKWFRVIFQGLALKVR